MMIHNLVKVRGADFCDDQFPIISTIGRGPKGEQGEQGEQGESLKFADPIEWDSQNTYEMLTVVLYQGDSYISKQAVPVGIDISDESHWAHVGDFNAQLEAYRQETAQALQVAQDAQALLQSLKNASMLGFSSDPENAASNVALFNSLNEKIYADIPIYFNQPVTFTKDKYITGNKLIYNGQTADDFFVTMAATENAEADTLHDNIMFIVECNNIINGVSWHGGIGTNIEINCYNPLSTGVQIERNETPTYKPSYGNTYRILVHKSIYVTRCIGVNIYASDDNYTFVETGNFQTGVVIYANDNKFGYIHPWIASDDLFDGSIGVSVAANYTSGSISIDTLFCDSISKGIVVYAETTVNINFLFNFWNDTTSYNFTGVDRPFDIRVACRLNIATLYWKYKNGTFDNQTGLSNCNIAIQENDRFVSIGKLIGISFIGDITNCAECSFKMVPTDAYTYKYTNIPSTLVESTDSNCLKIERPTAQVSNDFLILNTQYTIMANRDNKFFVAQSNAGATPTWYVVNMQTV